MGLIPLLNLGLPPEDDAGGVARESPWPPSPLIFNFVMMYSLLSSADNGLFERLLSDDARGVPPRGVACQLLPRGVMLRGDFGVKDELDEFLLLAM